MTARLTIDNIPIAADRRAGPMPAPEPSRVWADALARIDRDIPPLMRAAAARRDARAARQCEGAPA